MENQGTAHHAQVLTGGGSPLPGTSQSHPGILYLALQKGVKKNIAKDDDTVSHVYNHVGPPCQLSRITWTHQEWSERTYKPKSCIWSPPGLETITLHPQYWCFPDSELRVFAFSPLVPCSRVLLPSWSSWLTPITSVLITSGLAIAVESKVLLKNSQHCSLRATEPNPSTYQSCSASLTQSKVSHREVFHWCS